MTQLWYLSLRGPKGRGNPSANANILDCFAAVIARSESDAAIAMTGSVHQDRTP
jgi:hypothetical protein